MTPLPAAIHYQPQFKPSFFLLPPLHFHRLPNSHISMERRCNNPTYFPLSEGVLETIQPPKSGTRCPMSRRNNFLSRRLGLESLESRQLMAAVTASVNGLGDLIVTGDDDQNNLQMVQ